MFYSCVLLFVVSLFVWVVLAGFLEILLFCGCLYCQSFLTAYMRLFRLGVFDPFRV